MAIKKAKAKTVARKTWASKATAPKTAAAKVAPKGPVRWGAAQEREFDAIQQRAKSLGQAFKPADFDSQGNLLPGPWADMLADLDAWAKKYKVKLKTHEHEHAPAPGGAGTTPTPYSGTVCPPTTTASDTVSLGKRKFKINYTCTLRRQTWLGRCVYTRAETSWS